VPPIQGIGPDGGETTVMREADENGPLMRASSGCVVPHVGKLTHACVPGTLKSGLQRRRKGKRERVAAGSLQPSREQPRRSATRLRGELTGHRSLLTPDGRHRGRV